MRYKYILKSLDSQPEAGNDRRHTRCMTDERSNAVAARMALPHNWRAGIRLGTSLLIVLLVIAVADFSWSLVLRSH